MMRETRVTYASRSDRKLGPANGMGVPLDELGCISLVTVTH